MRIEDASEWPWLIWPYFIEMLRAFALDDTAQEAYFPKFETARHFDLSEGSMLAEDALRPTFSEMNDWSKSLLVHNWMRDNENEVESQMLETLATTFRKISDQTWRRGQTIYNSKTDEGTFATLRPQLRSLCLQALQLFGEPVRPPETPWDEIITP